MLRPIKIRDRKAPRFRRSKGRYIVLNQALFKSYKQSVDNPVEDYNVFKSIIEDFNELIKDAAITNRDGVKLPAWMGILAVCSYRPKKRLPVNWIPSEENGVKLKEFNLHTGGLGCKIVYSCYTAKYKFRNWALWKFEGNRDFKTKVSSAFIANYQHYKRLDNKSTVSKMFKDNHITKFANNESIRTSVQCAGNEQNDQCGQ